MEEQTQSIGNWLLIRTAIKNNYRSQSRATIDDDVDVNEACFF